ncbi:MAG: hypothetical protein WD009_08080 [Phycisphaeraceae bacterium]
MRSTASSFELVLRPGDGVAGRGGAWMAGLGVRLRRKKCNHDAETDI